MTEAERLDKARFAVRRAVNCLLETWDAEKDIEAILETEVTIDTIEELASHCLYDADELGDEDIDDAIKALRKGAAK